MNVVTQHVVHNKLTTENIWQEFSDRLYGFIAKRVDNHEDARDILQDIFLKIHSKKDTLKDNEKVVSWIYQLTRNAIIDHYRQSKKKQGNCELPELIDTNQHNGLANCIKPFIDRLSDHERQLIQLIELKGLKQKDIANEIGMPYSTLKTQIQRTRKKLRKMFLDCCDIEFDRRGSIIDNGDQKRDCEKC